MHQGSGLSISRAKCNPLEQITYATPRNEELVVELEEHVPA